MNEWEERMGNVTKIKLKSAKHKTKVGERGGKQQQHFYPVLFTKHGEMLNDKLRNYEFLVLQNSLKLWHVLLRWQKQGW